MPEPKLDEYLLASGERVEDLSRIAAAQLYRPSGAEITRDSLGMLVDAVRKPVRPRRVLPEGVARRVQREQLQRAELLDADGALTEYGRDLGGLLARHAHQVRVEATDGRAAFSFSAFGSLGRYLTVATAPPTTFRGRSPASGREVVDTARNLRLDVVHHSRLPAEIVSWLGIGPGWSMATNPLDLPESLVTARLDDPLTAPPEDADEHLREVWRQPWFSWTLNTSSGRPGLAMIDAGPRGQFTLTARPGKLLEVAAAPSHLVWLTLLRLLKPPS
jgi:hypothetical protein